MSANNGLLTYFKPRRRGLKRERPSVMITENIESEAL